MARLPADFAGRVRAARGYAGVGLQSEFAKLLGVSGSTVKNYENGKSKPQERAIPETISRLVNASKLPEWFFTVPRLDRLPRGPTGEIESRLDHIEDLLSRLAEALLEEAVGGAEGDELPDEGSTPAPVPRPRPRR